METQTAKSLQMSEQEWLTLATSLAGEPGVAWLDSSMQIGERGWYSIVARRPSAEIQYANGLMTMRSGDGVSTRRVSALAGLTTVCTLAEDQELCAIGFISYETCLELAGAPVRCHGDLPGFQFNLYTAILEYDHKSQKAKVTDQEAAALYFGADRRKITEHPPNRAKVVSASETRTSYLAKVARIKEYIHEGDIYQANFTSRIILRSESEPLAVYRQLRLLSPAPYACYLDFGRFQILSSSPERMLRMADGQVMTSPIKGTIAAGTTPEEQEANRLALLSSTKDMAELLMIIDLERNDLGRIAEVGSVIVDPLFRTEEYRSLIHLVSDVSAKVRHGTLTSQVLEAILPGGSITGAPKLRAIAILQELESVPRGVYTGCIGYVRPGQTEFNLAIRTMVHQNGMYQLHAGGGIVADSAPEAEYQEMMLKASNMLRAVGLEEKGLECLRR